jgi:UDP-N-acetylglucosamine diphosphorylase/glucosamine-1-phosphate N-acetyltransferase
VLNSEQIKDFSLEIFNHTIKKETNSTGYIYIYKIWHLFTYNDQAIRFDFKHITANRTSELLNETNILINKEQIFVEPGARVQGAFLNASTGPIYISKNAEVMEGSFIRGPFALGESSSTKMGTKIYGATTIGPHCKVGGEVSNSILFGYSNKGHDGFIGNAVIGEWCNIGADSNSSNLKNNYANVKVWSHILNKFENTGLTFCGLMMADHAKCGINTMFNTATVVGVAANIFGSGFPRTFIPSFAWGGAQGFETFQLNKVIEMATQMCQRRGVDFDEIEQAIIKHVFDETVSQRYWEKQEN